MRIAEVASRLECSRASSHDFNSWSCWLWLNLLERQNGWRSEGQAYTRSDNSSRSKVSPGAKQSFRGCIECPQVNPCTRLSMKSIRHVLTYLRDHLRRLVSIQVDVISQVIDQRSIRVVSRDCSCISLIRRRQTQNAPTIFAPILAAVRPGRPAPAPSSRTFLPFTKLLTFVSRNWAMHLDDG